MSGALAWPVAGSAIELLAILVTLRAWLLGHSALLANNPLFITGRTDAERAG